MPSPGKVGDQGRERAMRAVIRRDKQLVCDEIADLKPDQGQVLVRTLACGICGSDLHALHHMEHMIDLTSRANGGMTNGFDPTADTVFGHEFCAEILDHGPGTLKTLTPSRAQSRTKSSPGSLMAGIPASETSATLSPFLRRSTILSPLCARLCSK